MSFIRGREVDPEDPWLFKEERTAQELQADRAKAGNVPQGTFTCDDCPLAPRCTLVYDGYNTDGDCLYLK